MKKANTFFFLAEVNDHILADFKNSAGLTCITFKHQDDKSTNSLTIIVEPKEHKFYVLHYKIMFNGEEFSTAKSDLIPHSEIFGVIASLANEIITE